MSFRTDAFLALGAVQSVCASLIVACTLSAGTAGPKPRSLDVAETLLGVFQLLAMSTWVLTDARRHHRTPFFDFGLLLFATSWFGLAGYCFWSRGWRGFLPLSAFFVLFVIGPALGGTFLYIASPTFAGLQRQVALGGPFAP